MVSRRRVEGNAMKKRLNRAVAAALVLGGSALGCHPRVAAKLAAAAIITAAIVGTAHILAHHDAHFHSEHCGHHRRWHEGRYVYHYGGHWEYYDPHAGRWYYYR
jgi:hypothetical protein